MQPLGPAMRLALGQEDLKPPPPSAGQSFDVAYFAIITAPGSPSQRAHLYIEGNRGILRFDDQRVSVERLPQKDPGMRFTCGGNHEATGTTPMGVRWVIKQ